MKKIAALLLLSLILAFHPASVHASHNSPDHAHYDYLIAIGDLCGLPEPNPCPAISQSSNGDTIELVGQGTIHTSPDEVTGGGTFVHKDKDGNVLGSGDWHALELVKFRYWGPQSGLPNNFVGGRARIKIHLAPSGGGPGFEATLKIICAIGDVAPGAHEGVELVAHGAPNFTHIVSGLTLFIRTE